MSYDAKRWAGSGCKQSSSCTETFSGNHSFGGHCVRSISNPSMRADAGRFRARSTSHILIKNVSVFVECHKCPVITHPVPMPISATLRLLPCTGRLGCKKKPPSLHRKYWRLSLRVASASHQGMTYRDSDRIPGVGGKTSAQYIRFFLYVLHFRCAFETLAK